MFVLILMDHIQEKKKIHKPRLLPVLQVLMSRKRQVRPGTRPCRIIYQSEPIKQMTKPTLNKCVSKLKVEQYSTNVLQWALYQNL